MSFSSPGVDPSEFIPEQRPNLEINVMSPSTVLRRWGVILDGVFEIGIVEFFRESFKPFLKLRSRNDQPVLIIHYVVVCFPEGEIDMFLSLVN